LAENIIFFYIWKSGSILFILKALLSFRNYIAGIRIGFPKRKTRAFLFCIDHRHFAQSLVNFFLGRELEESFPYFFHAGSSAVVLQHTCPEFYIQILCSK